MNRTLIALDFLLQAIEAGIDPDEASASTIYTFSRLYGTVSDEEYEQTCDVIERIARVAKGGDA